AIALVLSPLKVPAPYAPFLIYGLWEIPIIAAFFLYGARLGVAVAIINFLGLLAYFRGELDAGPIYNLIAILSMMLGMLFAYRITGFSSRLHGSSLPFWLALILGSSVRVLVMTLVNALLLPMPPPLGFNVPLGDVEQFYGLPQGTILLFIALFNSSVAIYTIPIARIVTTAVSSTTRIPTKYGR
ncbi:MAG: hypothetical protein ACE5KU_00975, partial [Nitrososphaerales archaeon]